MTCGDPTLFFGASIVAANALPPSAIARAAQAITPAGVGRSFFMCLPFFSIVFPASNERVSFQRSEVNRPFGPELKTRSYQVKEKVRGGEPNA